MSSRSDIPGLVVTSGSQTSAALGELINCCGWTALLQASVRSLCEELIVRKVGCVLFWFEDASGVRATLELVAWLHEREPNLLLVAIAYRLDEDIESAVRRAGIHIFIFIHKKGEIAAVVSKVLGPQLTSANRYTNTSSGAPTNVGISPEEAGHSNTGDAEN